MEKAQLVFVPAPGMGHIVSAVEVAKLLLTRCQQLSVTVLILNHSSINSKVHSYIESQRASSSIVSTRLRFIDLPKDETELLSFFSFVNSQKSHVKEAVLKITQSDFVSSVDSPQLVGFVVDTLCASMIDVANEFGVPSYIFFSSGAAFLGFMLYVQKIYDEEKFDPTELKDSDAELQVLSLINPFPGRVMPSAMLSKDWFPSILDNIRRFREANGIIVNTFLELESYAIESLKMPPVYPVGPILDMGSDGRNTHKEIMRWLDDQPPSTVVFLCFGSKGTFSQNQVTEIACALEHSGHRFLWSLRRPAPPGLLASPSDYEDPQEVLPEGFLDRTTGIGKVIGWAPQVAVLGHPAVGGFVSHCGWNSILESIWFGVPIATWPLFAEQQFNAFEMVVELGLAVEIKMDYRNDSGVIVNCDEIERGIRCLMKHDGEKRRKVKEISEKSRRALMEGGSSYSYLGSLIKDVMDNLS
ncbi:anthocyanidin 3-O-glucosyltransferase 1-like [Hevea brasiliensis]|uniref:anthocyanidin 3-O-glucosyltransferase 1-like n=1 Tax=Hevea brasiliensis TaxID=3981 RepID=UPI0025E566EF|nr:anthocyanidin 3-O-glucosyltransferase 1-like [Hevea brasiliensis]